MSRMDLRAMAMKEYSAFPKVPPLLEPHHQIDVHHMQDTRCVSLTPLQSVYSAAPNDMAIQLRTRHITQSSCRFLRSDSHSLSVSLNIYIYMCVCVCVGVCVCVYMYKYVYIYAYIYKYINIYIYMYVSSII